MYERELEVVTAAVRQAAGLLRAEAQRPGGPRGSGATAPVDGEIGALLCRRIAEAFPRDTVIAEEGGGRRGTSPRAFVIDPHDGTFSFLRGRRETSISVGLVDRGDLVLGVVHAPLATPRTGPHGLLATWARGAPLRRNGRPATPLDDSQRLAASSLVLVSAGLDPPTLAENRRLLAPARVEACASIATRLALVAVGEATLALTLNRPLEPWDFAGAQALLRAAGGDLYGPGGRPVRWSGLSVEPASRRLAAYFGAGTAALATTAADALRPLLRAP